MKIGRGDDFLSFSTPLPEVSAVFRVSFHEGNGSLSKPSKNQQHGTIRTLQPSDTSRASPSSLPRACP